MKKLIFTLTFVGLSLCTSVLDAQIFAPEGINLPGAWNLPAPWTNPPAQTVLKLNDGTATPPQRKICQGQAVYNTTIKAAASGGDVVGGSYEWLFTSGPNATLYNNKWSAVNVTMNTVQTYTKEGAANNNITVVNDKWYVMNYQDNGYANTKAVFMEISAAPVAISSTTGPTGIVPVTPQTVNITLSAAKASEEIVKVAYTTDNWATRTYVDGTGAGTAYTAIIPGQSTGTTVKYYSFTTTIASPGTTQPDATLAVIAGGCTEFTYITDAALAVELVDFKAKKNVNKVELSWLTATPKEDAQFNVERSKDGSNFENLSTIQATQKEVARGEYAFTDVNPSKGVNYYRLKATDKVGKTINSRVLTVDFNKKNCFFYIS